MNINLNFRSSPAPTPATDAAASATPAAGARTPAGTAEPLFTVTRGAAAPEDIQAANLPADTLSRDDALGRLVDAAFNLPPPPMPNF